MPLIVAFFYMWLYNRTGSVLVCLLLHASFTPAQNLLTLTVAPEDSDGGGLADSIDLVILVVYVASAICLTLATRGRLGVKPASGSRNYEVVVTDRHGRLPGHGVGTFASI